jgi:hypothetical protein
MKFIVWLIRVLVFVLLLVLALANTQTATLNFRCWLRVAGAADPDRSRVLRRRSAGRSAVCAAVDLPAASGERTSQGICAPRVKPRRSSTSRRCRPSFNTDAARISRGFRLCFDISHGSGFLAVARDSRRVRARMGGVTL